MSWCSFLMFSIVKTGTKSYNKNNQDTAKHEMNFQLSFSTVAIEYAEGRDKHLRTTKPPRLLSSP